MQTDDSQELTLDTRSIVAAVDCRFRGLWLAEKPPLGFDAPSRRYPVAAVSVFREVAVRKMRDSEWDGRLPLTRWDKYIPNEEELQEQTDLWAEAVSRSRLGECVTRFDFQRSIQSPKSGLQGLLDWVDEEFRQVILVKAAKLDPMPRCSLDIAMLADVVEDYAGIRPKFHIVWIAREFPTSLAETEYPLIRTYDSPAPGTAKEWGVYETASSLVNRRLLLPNPNSIHCNRCPARRACPVMGDLNAPTITTNLSEA